MRYMLMCCFDEERWAKMPETQKGQIMQEYGEVIQGIVKSGHFRGGAQLQPTSTSTTVRERNGKLITIDGPFAETKEKIYAIHDADDPQRLQRKQEAGPRLCARSKET